MSRRRVVITGLGPISPIGIGAADYWSALLDSRSGIRKLRSFQTEGFDSQIGGEVDDIKVADAVPKEYRKAAKIMARDIVLAVVAAHRAVADSGLVTKCLIERGEKPAPTNVDSTRFGANIGAGLICADLPELAEALFTGMQDGQFSLARWGSEGMSNLTPLWLLKFLPNMLACHVTIVHDCQGPSNTITCGEASSHLAVGEAYRTIERGVADVVICGGAESKTSPMALMRQILAKRLSQRNDTPESACRPFGAGRDGTVVAEGGGLLILESLDHARARGARIYAEVIGFGASNDAAPPVHPSVPPSDGAGLALALRKALRDAGVTPQQVSLVGSAACGLVAHDAAEAAALRSVLGAEAARVAVMNVRGGLGNNGAGSGALDLIATALALHYNTAPPAINSDPIDPEVALRLVTGKPVDVDAEVAVSQCYALSGGQNAVIVMRRYREGA